jgi:CzcA family heavy metal efflux pump
MSIYQAALRQQTQLHPPGARNYKQMLEHLLKTSIKNRFLVAVLAVVLVVSGLYVAAHSTVDVLPEFAPPQISIQTEAPGMVPEEVETLVSLPLEAVLNGTPGVTMVRSISQTGISSITVVFQYGSDIYQCRQLVNEKIQLVQPRMPRGVGPPMMLPVMSVIGDIFKIGIVSDKTSLMDLRTIADWDIRNRILAVPGVARVLIFGGEQKQFQVIVNPEKLKSFGLTLDTVRQAVANSNVTASGGYLTMPERQLTIRALGRIQNIAQLANSVVATRDGTPILLRHVARVAIAPGFKVGDAIVNGQPGIELVISKQPGANTLEVTRSVQQALKEVQHELPRDAKLITIFRQADFIEKSINNVLFALATGGFLVVLVLLLFLFNWRTSLISLTAIPVSLISAILIIRATGGSINTMTLGGLAIAVGEVVDDAIVDVENVYKRLRENGRSDNPKSTLKVILDACLEVRSSVFYATFIVALVFLPVFTLSGVEGRIFSPLGQSYILATISSLVVALTLTPALCMYFLGRLGKIPTSEPPVVQILRTGYARLLSAVLASPRLVAGCAILLFLLCLSLLPFMGQTFLPEFKEDNLIVAAFGLPGQSLDATSKMGINVEKELLSHFDIVATGQRVGRAEMDDDAGGPNFSEFDIKAREVKRPLEETVIDMRHHLAEIPGTVFDIGSFISHRMDDVLSNGTRAEIAVKIFGPDLATLRSLGTQVAAELKTVRGAVDVRAESQVLIPEVVIRIDRLKASRYGLTADDLSREIETAFSGNIVSQVVDGQRLFGLRVLLDAEARHNFDLVKSTMIDTPVGQRIPLSQVADISINDGPNAVIRENVARRIVVQANTQGRDVVGVVEDAKRKIENGIKLPSNYYIVYAGEYAAQQEASRRLMVVSLLAFVGILILLRQGMPSWTSTVLVLANLPLATIGGILAVAMTGNVLSIGSLIGFISLFGISTRNSLLLVTRIDHLIDEGMPANAAIFNGALDRVTPVLMTATAAALGMLPLAVMGGSGRELEQPLAVVIVGGLFSSTALTLVVIPALFKLFLPKTKTPDVSVSEEIFS